MASAAFLQQAYLAYFGRPVDPTGAAAFMNASEADVAKAFSASAESQALYGSEFNFASVNNIYQVLFNRPAELAGAAYWINQVAIGNLTPATAALAILRGAQNADAVAITNKLAASAAFTAGLDTTAELLGYSGNTAAAAARDFLKTVVGTAATADAINAAIANVTLVGGSIVDLTTAQNIATATTFNGSLANASYDGQGPTLQGSDQLTGTNGTVNTLNIVDAYGSASDIMPVGLTLKNIQNVKLNTAGNAGQTAVSANGTNPDSAYGTFDTSAFASVANTVVNSQGSGHDWVQASGTSAIAVNHASLAGAVDTAGGTNVTVNTAGNGGVTVTGGFDGATTGGYATGDVAVTETGSGGDVHTDGGANVTINLTKSANNGAVTIGDAGTTAANLATLPTGNISITSAGKGNIDAQPSATSSTVTVNSAGGNVTVGQLGVANAAAVTVVDNAAKASGNDKDVVVLGGSAVNVTTNVANVYVGADNNAGFSNPTGNVTVNSATLGYSEVLVSGGKNVTVTAVNSEVQVGSNEDFDWGDTANTAENHNPTGAVVVTETAAVTYDWNPGEDNFLGAGGDSSSDQGYVSINGGTSATVSVKGQNVFVGSEGNSSQTAATGNVTVTSAAVLTGTNGVAKGQGEIIINGGAAVSVTTTGGDVQVGYKQYNTEATASTGNVTVTNTFSGPNTDKVDVLGGAAISITTTATTAGINVGSSSATELNAAGTALKSVAAAATGDVTIVDQTAAGVFTQGKMGFNGSGGALPINTKYGTGDITVNTNGSHTVSVTGGSGVDVTDINTTWATAGTAAGVAVGASSLNTVNLTGVTGYSDIYSDALTTLNLTNVYTNWQRDGSSRDIYIENYSANPGALTMGLNGSQFAINLSETKYNALNLNTTANASAVSFEPTGEWGGGNNSIATLNINAAAALTIAELSDMSKVLSAVNIVGSGAVNLGLIGDPNGGDSDDLPNAAKVTVDAHTATGSITVALDPTLVKFTGGSANNVVTLTNAVVTPASSQGINGGVGGSNTLVVDYYGDSGSNSNFNDAYIPGDFSTFRGFSNFSTLQFGSWKDNAGGYDTINNAGGEFDVTGFTNLAVGQLDNSLYLDQVANNSNLTILQTTDNVYVRMLGSEAAAVKDTLNINLGTVGGSSNVASATHISVVDYSSFGVVDTINLATNGLVTGTNSIDLHSTEAVTLKISGATNLNLDLDGDAFTTIDASTSSAAIQLENTFLAGTATVTGGAGLLTMDLSNNSDIASVDTVKSGSGGLSIDLGWAGEWNTSYPLSGTINNGLVYPTFGTGQAGGLTTQLFGKSGTGSQTIDLAASTAVKDTLFIANEYSQVAAVKNFSLVGSAAADYLVNNNFGTVVLDNQDSAVKIGGGVTTGSPSAWAEVAAVAAMGLDNTGALAGAIMTNTLTYTVKNGVISFSGAAAATLTNTQLLAAAQIIVNVESADDSCKSALVNLGGNAYMVEASDNSYTSNILNGNNTSWSLGGIDLQLNNSPSLVVNSDISGNYDYWTSGDWSEQVNSNVVLTFNGATYSFSANTNAYKWDNSNNYRNQQGAVNANLSSIVDQINNTSALNNFGIIAHASGNEIYLTGLSAVFVGMSYSGSDQWSNNQSSVATGGSITTNNQTVVVNLQGDNAAGFAGSLSVDAANNANRDYTVAGANSAVALGDLAYQTVDATDALSNANHTFDVAGKFTWVNLYGGNDTGSNWTHTETINNLASYGVVELMNQGEDSASSGNLTITQQGNSGQSLVLLADEANGSQHHFTTVTTTGDWAIGLEGGLNIGNLVDSTNTVTDINISNLFGAGSDYASDVTLSKITGSALKTIDATHLTGTLTLGGVGHQWVNDSQNNATVAGLTGHSGMTIKMGAGTNDIVDVLDTGLTITEGSNYSTNYIQTYGANNSINVSQGDSYILANGATNTITLNTDDNVAYVEAAGAGDVFNVKVTDYADAYIAGLNFMYTANGSWNGTSDMTTSVGANDTFNLTGGSYSNVYAWLGANNTVNIGSATTAFEGYVELLVKGDTVGNVAAPNMEVINIASNSVLSDGFNLSINFGHEVTGPVNGGYIGNWFDDNGLINVSTATSLADALNIAAAQGAQAAAGNWVNITTGIAGSAPAVLEAGQSVVDWFQYGGNTYIVEANNTGTTAAAHAGLQANDVVIKLTGLVDLSYMHIVGDVVGTNI